MQPVLGNESEKKGKFTTAMASQISVLCSVIYQSIDPTVDTATEDVFCVVRSEPE
jgi:hypothetical protein